MSANIDSLQNAINNLTSTIQGQGGKDGSASSGIVQGITESAVTQVMNPKLFNSALANMGDSFNQSFDKLKQKLEFAFTGWEESLGKSSSKIVNTIGKLSGGLASKLLDMQKIDYSPDAKDDTSVKRKARLAAYQKKNEDDKEGQKGEGWVKKFNSVLNKATLGLLGFITAGLAGTVQGYKLTTAFERLSYQVADAFIGPIESFTRGINEVAATFRFLNTIPLFRTIMNWVGGILIGIWALKGISFVLGPVFSAFGTLVTSIGGANVALLALAAVVGMVIAKLITDKTDKDQKSREQHEVGYAADFHRAEKAIREKDPKAEAEAMAQMHRKWAHAEEVHKSPYKFGLWEDSREERKQANVDKQNYGSGIEQLNKFKESLKNEPAQKMPAITKGEKAKEDANKHIQATFTTSFVSLAALWENMNKMATEKPGLEQVTSWLETTLGPAIKKYLGPEPTTPASKTVVS